MARSHQQQDLERANYERRIDELEKEKEKALRVQALQNAGTAAQESVSHGSLSCLSACLPICVCLARQPASYSCGLACLCLSICHLASQPASLWSGSKRVVNFLGSLYKEVAKTAFGTVVYHFQRQIARKNIPSFEKHCVLDLECRILSQEPSDSCILYFNVIFRGK